MQIEPIVHGASAACATVHACSVMAVVMGGHDRASIEQQCQAIAVGSNRNASVLQLLQRLADTREVIIFDNMRTASSTDTSTASLSIPLMANSTAALINKLGLQTPDIWG